MIYIMKNAPAFYTFTPHSSLLIDFVILNLNRIFLRLKFEIKFQTKNISLQRRNTMRKILCISVIFCMLMILPITAIGSETATTVDISAQMNYETVAVTGTAIGGLYKHNNTAAYSTLMYNGANSVISAGTVTVGEIDFSLIGLTSGSKDSVNMNSSSTTITFPEPIAISKIGFIATTANTTATAMTATLNFASNLSENISASVVPIGTSGTNSIAVGQSVKLSTGFVRNTVLSGADAYLNAYFYEPQSKAKVASITFNQGAYYVLAVSYIENTETVSASEINSSYNDLAGETIKTLSPENAVKASELYSQLEMAKDNNVAGIENIVSKMERIDNLQKGYYLYHEEKDIADYIDANDSYLSLSETSRTDVSNISDVSVLEALKAKYEEAQSFYDAGKNDELCGYLGYFNETDEITVNVADKDKIVALIAAVPELEDAIEIENNISSKVTICEGYVVSDLADETKLNNLTTLIGYYEEAEAFDETSVYFDVDYDHEKATRLKKLGNDYVNYRDSEKPVFYDLTSYFTRSIIGTDNETVTAGVWGFSDSVTAGGSSFNGFAGFSKGHIDSKAPASNNYVFNQPAAHLNAKEGNPASTFLTKSELVTKLEADGITAAPFYISPNRGANDKNAIVMNASEDIVTIPGSGRMSNYLFVLLSSGANENPNDRFEITVTYADGTVENHYHGLPWARAAGGYSHGSEDRKMYLNGNKVSISDAGQNYPNSILMRGYAIDVNARVISSISFTNFGASIPILAVTEIPSTNALFKSYATATWNTVKNLNVNSVTTADIPYIKKMITYVKEAENRGIDIKDIIGAEGDLSILDSVSELVLGIDSEETVRVDKTKVKSTVKFTSPVTESDLKANFSVTSNGEPFTNYTFNFLSDEKTAVIELPTTINGGENYIFTIKGTLKNKNYQNITLGNDYTYSFYVPAYAEFKLNYDVKNNSQDTITYFAGATVVSVDEKTLTGQAGSDTGTLTAGQTKPSGISVDEHYGNVVRVLWDSNMKTISQTKSIPSCHATVNAAADYTAPTFSLTTNTLKVEGFTPSRTSGKIVNIKIEKDNGDLVYAGTQRAIEGGYFCYELILPEGSYPTSFNMNITLGGDDDGFLAVPDVYYASVGEKQSIVSTLSNGSTTVTQIENLVDDIKQKLGLDFAPANAISDTAFATAIYANKSLFAGKTPAQAQGILKDIALVTAFNEDKESALFNSNGDFLHDDVVGYSSIDTANVTIYEMYKGNTTDTENDDGTISDAGKQAVRTALFGNTTPYQTTSDIINEAKAQIFLAGLNYPDSEGTGYVANVLTQANAGAVGITNISDYLGLSDADKSRFAEEMLAAKGSFNTIQSVYDFIDTFEPTPAGEVSQPSGNLGGNGGNGGGGGGGSSSSSSSGAFYTTGIDANDDTPTVTPSQAAATAPTSVLFTDVDKSHWAWDSIISLYNKEIMTGKGNKVFDPSSNLTRGELVKMLCVAYGLTDNGYASFSDTNGKWYDRYAAIAFANGLVTGVSDGIFDGDAPVTREQICTILWRAEGSPILGELTFTDADSISDYAKGAVSYMAKKTVVNGYADGSFKGSNYANRAEVAKILATFLKVKDMPVSETPVVEETTEEETAVTEEVTTEETEKASADEKSADSEEENDATSEEVTEETANEQEA